MTMEEFIMLLDECFENLLDEDNQGLFVYAYGTRQLAFKTLSDRRWAIQELEKFVENDVGAGYEPQEVYKFVDAVVEFEYQMDLYSKVDDRKRLMFENARTIAEEVEDLLNAML